MKIIGFMVLEKSIATDILLTIGNGKGGLGG